MRLVDHHQPGVVRQRGQHLIPKVGVVEPFRADQKHVEIPAAHPVVDLVPVGDVARVDGRGMDSGPLGRGHLVAHQRQQWRHDHGWPVPGGSEQFGGDEVDRRLAPPRALHDQCATALHDQRFDRDPLVVSQHRLRSGQLLENRLGLIAGCHATIVPAGSDERAYGSRQRRRAAVRSLARRSRVPPMRLLT